MTNLQGLLRYQPSNSLPRVPSLASLGSVLRRNQELLSNAGSLAATTGITSFLGFAYWFYAAKVFSADAVGAGAAAISTMMLLGTLGMFGLDTMLIGELPRGGNRGGLIMASCIVSFVVSLVLGLGWSVISLAFGSDFVGINGTVGRMAVFSFGVGITGATLVFDAATIGLMRGGIQLSRNVAVSVAKMAALPAIALVLHDNYGVGIMLAWVIGMIVSLLPVAVMIRRGGGRVLHRPDWSTLWRLRKLALAHNWLNLAINIPGKLVLVLVAVVVSSSANGAFYMAVMISSFLTMIPQSLATVLFAVAASAPEKFAEKLRFVLRMSLVIGIPGGLLMGVLAHPILTAYGPSYGIATGPLWLLIAGYLPNLSGITYIAVARAQGRFNQAAVMLTVFAALRMAALLVGGKLGGLYGLSYAMLAVLFVQSIVTTPSVLRIAYGRVTLRSAADSATTGELRLRTAERAEDRRRQQEAGLGALLSLSTRAARPRTDALRAIPQRMVDGENRHRRRTAVPVTVTRANPAIAETNWWPDADEASFRSRQEMGIAALIAIATRAPEP